MATEINLSQLPATATVTGAIYHVNISGVDYQAPQSTVEASIKSAFQPDVSAFKRTGTTTFESWYDGTLIPTTKGTNAAINVDTLVLTPFIAGKTFNLDRIAVDITVAGVASSVARLGIYESSDIISSTLVVDSGAFVVDSTGVKSQTISIGLTAGKVYWLAFITNSSTGVSIRGYAANGAHYPNVLGNIGSGSSTTQGLATTLTYGALPADISAQTYSPVTTSSTMPSISVRATV